MSDVIFPSLQLLCTMNSCSSRLSLVLSAILKYLQPNELGELEGQLSEPLLWFLLRVLDCEPALQEFVSSGK